MKNLIVPPISFIPNVDPNYSEHGDNSTLRRIYVSLLWITLPVVALFRIGIGDRYFSKLNILFSFILVSVISIQLFILNLSFEIPYVKIEIELAYILIPTIILTVIYSKRIFVLLIITMVSAILFFLVNGNPKRLIDFYETIVAIYAFVIASSIASKIYNKFYPNGNSYFYGYSLLNLIKIKNVFVMTIVETILYSLFFSTLTALLFTYINGYNGLKGGVDLIGLNFLFIISHPIMGYMQAYATKQYYRNMSDSLSGTKNSENSLDVHQAKSIRG